MLDQATRYFDSAAGTAGNITTSGRGAVAILAQSIGGGGGLVLGGTPNGTNVFGTGTMRGDAGILGFRGRPGRAMGMLSATVNRGAANQRMGRRLGRSAGESVIGNDAFHRPGRRRNVPGRQENRSAGGDYQDENDQDAEQAGHDTSRG